LHFVESRLEELGVKRGTMKYLLIGQPSTRRRLRAQTTSPNDPSVDPSVDPQQNLDERILGRFLREFLEMERRDDGSPLKTGWICSGDLAHMHHTDCQEDIFLPSSDKGILTINVPQKGSKEDLSAEEYDQLIQRWVLDNLDQDFSPLSTLEEEGNKEVDSRAERVISTLMGKGQSLEKIGLSCGFDGFLLLQSVLSSLSLNRLCQQYPNLPCLRTTKDQPMNKCWKGHVLSCCAPTYYGMMVAFFLPSSQ